MATSTFRQGFRFLDSKIHQIESSYRQIAHVEFKRYLLPIIQLQIKEFILSGGSADLKFSWGYWKRSGRGWSYQTGKATNFSNGWKGATMLPIHPLSFLARKVNRTPMSNMFALNDTKELIRSFTSISDFVHRNGASMFIGSTSSKLDYHEKEFKYKRKIIEPYSIQFAENKMLHKTFMDRVCLQLEKI